MRRLGLVALLGLAVTAGSEAEVDGVGNSPDCDPAHGAANRLAAESSPYLLLHACNPVDWYPWGEEAIEKARRGNRPIFLSIGYSTCFWCHVMEREAFSDPQIAALMNRWFVNVKVDREERPDLDEIYMTATQLLTQGGGWPNSVFLTPSLRPFFAGTYFPPVDRPGRPAFATVLEAVHLAWTDRRDELEAISAKVSEGMATVLAAHTRGPAPVPPASAAAAVVEALEARFDSLHGGFGGAPKFPSPANLQLLADAARAGDDEAARMVHKTLEEMSRGGIFDQLGGGFHRYSTDAAWRIPHFEKMLYDNALLAELLVEFGSERQLAELVRAGRATLDFMLEVLRLPAGGFKSAIDAEIDGEEGAYYTWTRPELEAALEDDFTFLSRIYGFAGAPNFEGERYALYRAEPLADLGERTGTSDLALAERIARLDRRLLRRRDLRQHPRIDDKVLTDWNGMAVSALARSGRALAEPRYVEAAARAADFLLASLRDAEGPLLHTWRGGVAKLPAYLDDYAFFTRGLIDLHQVTGERRWLEAAVHLAEEMETRLRIPDGGYYLNARSDDVLFQPRTVLDGAIPAANGIAIQNLLALAELTGVGTYRQRAEAALRAFARDLESYPRAAQSLALAVRRYHRTARAAASEEAVTAASPADEDSGRPSVVAGRARVTAPMTDPGWSAFEITLEIAPNWHLNANPASADYLIPTRVEGVVRNLRYPAGEAMTFNFTEIELDVYSGRLRIEGEVAADRDDLIVIFQACDDRRCLPPERLRVALEPAGTD